jgi:hypothetical protein
MNISQNSTNGCTIIAKYYAHSKSAQNGDFRFVKNDEIQFFDKK